MISNTYIHINKKIETSVKKVLASRFLVQGKIVTNLEKKIADLNSSKYTVMVNSGTAALHTALASLGIKAGDEVITTVFSFIATANAILMCGAKPIFVDIQEESFNIDPDLIESKISPRTKAILTVDLFGRSCDYNKIIKIAKKYKLKVISDSCQAIGAKYKNKPISTYVDIACFSFYATKNITTGEGGALVMNNKKIYNFAKRFRQHGQDMEKPYIYYHLGYNYRSTDILAAIGLEQITSLIQWNTQRYRNAQIMISQLKNIQGLILPDLSKKEEHVFHQFTIRITKKFLLKREELYSYLFKHGVTTGIYYPTILAEHTHIKKISPYKIGMYPVAEKISREVLSLPVHPMLKGQDIKKIISLIKKASYEKS